VLTPAAAFDVSVLQLGDGVSTNAATPPGQHYAVVSHFVDQFETGIDDKENKTTYTKAEG